MSTPVSLENTLRPTPPVCSQNPLVIALTIILGAGLVLASRFCSSRQWSMGLKLMGTVVLVKGVFETWRAFTYQEPPSQNKVSQRPVEVSVSNAPEIQPQPSETLVITPEPSALHVQITLPSSAPDPRLSITKTPPSKDKLLASIEKNSTNYNPSIDAFRVPMWVTGILSGGYVGDPKSCFQFCPFLAKITLEDGSPIPLVPDDSFIAISLYHGKKPPEVAKILNIPFRIYLPSKFLENPINDAYKLRYDGVLLECIPDQNFMEELRLARLYVELYHSIENPLFGATYDPTWFYRVGGEGSLFKINDQKTFEERSVTEFRQKKSPNFTHGAVLLQNGKATFYWLMPLADFGDIDLIVNKEGLILYAEREKTAGFSPPPPGSTFITRSNDELFNQTISGQFEWMFCITWRAYPEFQSLNLETIKNNILNEPITCQSGYFSFSLTLDKHYPDRLLFSTFNNPFHTPLR